MNAIEKDLLHQAVIKAAMTMPFPAEWKAGLPPTWWTADEMYRCLQEQHCTALGPDEAQDKKQIHRLFSQNSLVWRKHANDGSTDPPISGRPAVARLPARDDLLMRA